MVALNRYRVLWSGGPGGAGVSTFYSNAASTSVYTDIRDFFNGIRTVFTDDVTWTFPASGDTLESTTGTLTGGWSAVAGAPVTGASVAAWTAGVGARVVWETGAVIGGRRVRGSTFLTGLQGASYDTDGTIGAAALSTIQIAATALASSGELVIWSRPDAGGSGTSTVLSARVPDQVSWLRTRRN